MPITESCGPGHTHVGDVSRAVRQDALVGRGHVRVGAHHGGDAAVEIPAHGLLFAGGFGVNVDDDHFDVAGKLGEFAIGGAEGVSRSRP